MREYILRTVILAFLSFAMIFSSGCVYTRLTEKNLEWGNVYTFADCSHIVGKRVHSAPSGHNYIRVAVKQYQRTPAALGMTMYPLGVFYSMLDGISYRHADLKCVGTHGNTWLEIPDGAVKYLTAETPPDVMVTPCEFKTCGKITEKMDTVPVKRAYPAPLLLTKAGSEDAVMNSLYLGNERSFAGYLSWGLLPLSVCCDVAGTVLCTTGSCLWVLPGIVGVDLLITGLGVQAPLLGAPVVEEQGKVD